MFSSEICEIFKNICFAEHLPVAASMNPTCLNKYKKQLLILNIDGRDFTRQIKIHQIFWDFLWCSPATLLRRDFGTGVSCQFYKIFHFTFFEEPFHCCITTRYFQNIWRSFIQSRHLTTKMGVKQQKS